MSKIKQKHSYNYYKSNYPLRDPHIESKIRAFHWDPTSRKLYVTPEVYKWDLNNATYRSMTKKNPWIWWESVRKHSVIVPQKSQVKLKAKGKGLKVKKTKKATKGSGSSKNRVLKKPRKSKAPATKKVVKDATKKPEKKAVKEVTKKTEKKTVKEVTKKPEKKVGKVMSKESKC